MAPLSSGSLQSYTRILNSIMKEFEFNARVMGTDLSISIVTNNPDVAEQLFNESLARLVAHEAEFSRFIPTSALSQLNSKRSLVVSPLFFSLIEKAKDLYVKTDGYFNPLLQIERQGYTSSWETLGNTTRSKDSTPYNIDPNAMILDKKTRTVTLAPGQKLDLGGFLKGYLAEEEARKIMSDGEHVHGVVVNIGGDIHTRGQDENDEIFIFEIENPIKKTTIKLLLKDTGLATSGTYKRTWTANNETVHHILARDGTKNPETGITSTSVIHSDGGTAEAYAKTLFTLPPTTFEAMTGESLKYALIYKDGTMNITL